MINVLNMIKTNVIGDLDEFKFDFEFDSASALPVNTYMLGRKTYVIAKDSTAKNISNNTYYRYDDTNGKWIKILSTPTPIIDNTKIISNGDYNIINNDVIGYNKVVADVDTIYTAEDEGKVVNNGSLVTQTAYPSTITENNTYNTTNYNSITVDVSGGSSFVAVDVDEFGYDTNYYSLLQTLVIPDGIKTIVNYAYSEHPYLTSVTIPNSLTSIGERAFYECYALETVTVEANSSLKTIGNSAFCDCYYLTSINIPNSVISIGNEAFLGCSSLSSSITIPSGVTTIEEGTFSGCQRIPSVTFVGNITTIEYNAFHSCRSIQSMVLPNSVTSIGQDAFTSCSALTSINIPEGVTTIEHGTFYECSSLTSINIPDSVTSIENKAFKDCSSLTSINISNNVTSIGDNVFQNCTSLTSLTIPNKVTTIGKNVFSQCRSLTSITFEPTTPPTLDGDLGIPTTCKIRVPQGTLAAYTSAAKYPNPSQYTYEEY